MTTFSLGLAGAVALVFWILEAVVLLLGLYAIYHCVRTREDAYRAVGKWQKNYWLIALIVCELVAFALGVTGLIIGAIGIILYTVDVRPKVNAVQGKRY
ncbi:DUF2516 family protein [Tsukamurella soli]